MLESAFQTFLLLAYFDIALISITIANYAVSASYLGRETRLSRRRMERKKQQLLENLRKLKKEAQIKDVKKELKESEAEEKRLGVRIFLLSWLGAVILPSVFFIWSFACAVIGMNSEILLSNDPQFLQQQVMIFSIGTMSIGLMVLLFVVRTIDSAAKRIPVPEFEVSFDKGYRKVKRKSKEKKKIMLRIRNKGEDIAEHMHIFFCFPSSFELHEQIGYTIFEQGLETDTPGHNAAIFHTDLIHIDTTSYYPILVTFPEKKGDYDIPIRIYERKTGKHKDELNIEIVE